MANTQRNTSYPAYRESGVEWLGEIPAHWTCLPLARVTRSRCDGPFGSGLKSQHYSVDGVRVIRLQNIGGPEFLNSDQVFVDESHADALGDHSILQGDLLVAGLGDDAHPVGRACVAPDGLGRAMVKADCFRFRLDLEKIVPEFAAYQLSANALAASGYLATGSTRSRVSLSTTAARRIVLPPISEQRAIVSFLNRETEKYRVMMTMKVRLIELLQEKRGALITRAVTKGLDPGVPMKHSVVEWLWKIPAHWETKRLKYLLMEPLQYGANEPSDHIDYRLPRYIRITDIREDGTLRDDSFRSLPEEIAKPYLLAEGDILFARSGATVGKTFRYDPSWGRAAYAGYLIRARPSESKVLSAFISYFTQSHVYGDWLLSTFIQATIQNVSAERYASLRMPVPGLGEQRAIASHLDRETAKIDALMANVHEAIDHLKELRTALISAAVTGKIDVRDAVP